MNEKQLFIPHPAIGAVPGIRKERRVLRNAEREYTEIFTKLSLIEERFCKELFETSVEYDVLYKFYLSLWNETVDRILSVNKPKCFGIHKEYFSKTYKDATREKLP
jgi:hypothetical protein